MTYDEGEWRGMKKEMQRQSNRPLTTGETIRNTKSSWAKRDEEGGGRRVDVKARG